MYVDQRCTADKKFSIQGGIKENKHGINGDISWNPGSCRPHYSGLQSRKLATRILPTANRAGQWILEKSDTGQEKTGLN